MNRLYLVPVETVPQGEGRQARGPKYFNWRFDPDPPALINSAWGMMDYGFTPNALLVAKNIIPIEHDLLVANLDIYAFPENLDQPVADPTVDTFFEGIHLPTDWLTPSTTYRELLRQVAGMFQFNQRYAGIVSNATGEWRSIFDTATLNTRLRQMTAQEQAWFLQTVESFGYDPELINDNSQLRLLIKQAGDYWAAKPFYIGGFEF